jgi:hypothetical protein
MINFFKFALVAVLFVVGGCTQLDDVSDGKGEATPPQSDVVVVEFLPAPGQFVNEGYEAVTMEEACNYAQSRIDNRYFVSLGGFGGYIVVKFQAPVANSEKGYDFGIFGNSFDGSSEPGVVWVAQDTNLNGVADDEWYELRGSESDKDTTLHNYTITYSRTEDDERIAWCDNRGESGVIERNSQHRQDYFPRWVNSDEYTLSGTLLPDNSEWSDKNQEWVLHGYEWGYADNFTLVDRGEDRANRFRIRDARSVTGEAVELDHIDFVKVQSATNKVHSAIGEVSTEVCGFVTYNSAE